MSRDRDDVKLGDIDDLNLDEPPITRPGRSDESGAGNGGAGGTPPPRRPASRPEPAKGGKGKKSGKGNGGGKAGWITATLLLAILLVVASGYFYRQITDLRARLDSRLTQSSERLGDLKSRLSATGQSSQALKNALAAQNKRLDEQSEQIRKLWDVSNKRNKGWIQENQQAVKALRGDVNDLQVAMAGIRKAAETASEAAQQARSQVANLDQRLASATKAFNDSSSQQRTQINQMQTQLDIIVDTLDRLRKQSEARKAALDELKRNAGDSADIARRLDDIEAAIKAFDKYRLQVNRRLDQLQQ